MKKKIRKKWKKSKKNKFSNALSHHCTDAWVTRPERPKGVKDVIKQAGRAQSRPEGRQPRSRRLLVYYNFLNIEICTFSVLAWGKLVSLLVIILFSVLFKFLLLLFFLLFIFRFGCLVVLHFGLFACLLLFYF